MEDTARELCPLEVFRAEAWRIHDGPADTAPNQMVSDWMVGVLDMAFNLSRDLVLIYRISRARNATRVQPDFPP